MRLPIVTSLISFVLLLCVSGSSLLLADDVPPAQKPVQQGDAPTRKVQSSDKAVARDVVYGLEEEEGRLYLTSQPLNGADRELKREEVKFEVPKEGQIVDLSLAKMGEKNLMAVVKVRNGDEFDFHCLTFIGPWAGGHIRDKYTFYQAKFFSTRNDLRILAVGGKQFQGSVYIVLGDIGLENENNASRQVSEGVIYFTNCPWPPSDGLLAPFRAKSVMGIAN